MILDLEGAVPQRAISPRLWWILSIASATVAGAALLVVNALPHEQLDRFVVIARSPSVLEQAFAKPGPARLQLELPADIAVPVPPGRVVGDYGPGRPAPTVRSYRLRGSSDLVVAVHGSYAVGWIVEPTSLSVVRWTENGMTYEVSSRSLGVRDLARLAEQIR